MLRIAACCSAATWSLATTFETNKTLITVPSEYNVISNREKDEQLKKKLFDILHQKKEECGTPGLSFSIHKNGACVMKGGIGLADVENNVPCTHQTVMRIASISKSLTSCAIGKLLDKGQLDLDSPVQNYVTAFPHKKWGAVEETNITTRHLLNHTSCIRGYFKQEKSKDPPSASSLLLDDIMHAKHGNPPVNFDENYLRRRFASAEEGLKLFKDDPLICFPGSEYNYSTHAYTLVSHVIEKVTSQEFKGHMRCLLDEMQLNNTRVDVYEHIVPNRASYYTRDSSGRLKRTPYVDNSYKWAGGGYLSNVDDVTRFGELMLTASQNDGGILSRSTVKELWRNYPVTKSKKGNSYALGWQVKDNAVYHTGGAVGASSILMIVLDESRDAKETNQKSAISNDVMKSANQSSPISRGSKSTNEIRPRGLVITILVNMQSVGLTDTALRIVKEFENHEK